eukprot:9200616-Karenia_brevis.AAC.1
MLPLDEQVAADRMGRVTQQSLSAALDTKEHDTFLASLSISDRADLLSEMLPGAKDFLEAAPNSSLGLAFEPEEFV